MSVRVLPIMEYAYLLDLGDQKIEIEVDNKDRTEETARRLSTYYAIFLRNNIDTCGDANKKKLLEKIISSLSSDGIVDMMPKLKDEKGKRRVLESVEEIMDAYEDDELIELVDEEINGNLFSYEKSFDIDSIRYKLIKIGDEVRGKKWRVEIDSAGEVVLCE